MLTVLIITLLQCWCGRAPWVRPIQKQLPEPHQAVWRSWTVPWADPNKAVVVMLLMAMDADQFPFKTAFLYIRP